MKRIKLNKYISQKIKKITFFGTASFLIIFFAFLFISYTELRDSKINSTKQAINYISIRIDTAINSSEIFYNNFINSYFIKYYNNYKDDNFVFEEFIYEMYNVAEQLEYDHLTIDSINYYFIDSKGVIYDSDYKLDIGLDISIYPTFWRRLQSLNPGEIRNEPITEETQTANNRLFSYLRLDDDRYFQIGISFNNLHDLLEDISGKFKNEFSYFNIFSSYYIALYDKNFELTDYDRNNFVYSRENNEIVYSYHFIDGFKFHYALDSPFGLGYKYIIFKMDNNRIILMYLIMVFLIIFIFISALYYSKRSSIKISKIIYPLTKIADDMEKFSKEKDTTIILEDNKVFEIDSIGKNYIKMAEEINSSFEELEASAQELSVAYHSNEVLINKMNRLTELTLDLDDHISKNDVLKKIFSYICDFLPDAKSGILLRTDGEYIKIISALGFNINDFNNINIESKYYKGYKEIGIFDPKEKLKIIEIDKISSEKLSLLKEYITNNWNHFSDNDYVGLYIPIYTEDKFYGNISLFIQTKNKRLKDETFKFVEFFSKLITLYLFSKDYGEQISKSYKNFSNKLATVAEAHDDETGDHIIRVGKLSEFFAKKLNLEEKLINKIRDFSPLHDIGKIFIPSSILKKPDKLTTEEWDLMKLHTIKSKTLLGDDERFSTALNIALYHHEKYDGSGYPEGLKGDEIPVEAQIVALIDVYDALRSKRSYKLPFSHEKTLDIILGKGTRTNINHFNPKLIKILKDYSSDIDKLWNDFNIHKNDY